MIEAIRITGLREFIIACDAAGIETKKIVRERLRRVGEVVRDDAATRFSRYNTRTASNFRVVVRRTGIVSVEQRLRKTTGLRPDFGGLQVTRGFIPAAEDKMGEFEREMEVAFNEIAGILEKS